MLLGTRFSSRGLETAILGWSLCGVSVSGAGARASTSSGTGAKDSGGAPPQVRLSDEDIIFGRNRNTVGAGTLGSSPGGSGLPRGTRGMVNHLEELVLAR